MKITATALTLAAIALAGCMGNTASGTGNAIAQTVASQAIAGSVARNGGSAANLAAIQQVGAQAQVAAATNNGAIATGVVPTTNIYTSGYASYSCEQLNTLIASLEPYTNQTSPAAGLSTVAGLAGLFGRGGSGLTQAATLANAQANVSQQQLLQLQAAQGVAAQKGC